MCTLHYVSHDIKCVRSISKARAESAGNTHETINHYFPYILPYTNNIHKAIIGAPFKLKHVRGLEMPNTN